MPHASENQGDGLRESKILKQYPICEDCEDEPSERVIMTPTGEVAMCLLCADERHKATREAAHKRAMDRWARNYNELNGAPEGPEDL